MVTKKAKKIPSRSKIFLEIVWYTFLIKKKRCVGSKLKIFNLKSISNFRKMKLSEELMKIKIKPTEATAVRLFKKECGHMVEVQIGSPYQKGNYKECVTMDWLRENCSGDGGVYINKLKLLAGNRKFIPIPDGKADESSMVKYPKKVSKTNGDLIAYPQGANDTGVVSSLASALEDTPWKESITKILALGSTSIKEMSNYMNKWGFQTKRMKQFKPLEDISSDVTLMALRSSSGNSCYVIALKGKKIYDSNKKYVMELNKEGLDAACLGNDTFVRSVICYRFTRASTKKRKRRHRKKKNKKRKRENMASSRADDIAAANFGGGGARVWKVSSHCA